jgi:succinate dehydrogenase/fumarate reductase cytochrome b subunit (b558 family)
MVGNRLLGFWRTVIGKKVVMAVTGVLLVGFVIAHMLGNLKIFAGPDEINAYSRFLREVGTPELSYGQLLWFVRIILLVCVTLHIMAAIQLTRMSRSARPIRYTVKRDIETTFAARMMRWGGVLLAAFIVFHLLHLTGGVVGFAPGRFTAAKEEVKHRIAALIAVKGKRSPDSFHRELGKIVWDDCGMARSDAGLRKALARIPELRAEFWQNLRIVGEDDELNQALEKANRIGDFLEIAELMCVDALDRTESCGGHFRVESQTSEGEAKRDDANFSYTAAWEWKGSGQPPALHKEPLAFEHVPLSQRSYK